MGIPGRKSHGAAGTPEVLLIKEFGYLAIDFLLTISSLIFYKVLYNDLKVGATIMGKDELVDIRNIIIDKNLIISERKKSFVQQIRNPYCYKYGDFVVKISFSKNETTLEECFKQYISAFVN